MSEWTEVPPLDHEVKRWRHGPTGVAVFVASHEDGYGVGVEATDNGWVDRVSIGDSDTGVFKEFDEENAAIVWASEWKEEDSTIRALAGKQDALPTQSDQ